jgi:membrane protein YqaA with SNARE-associated domain
MARTSAREFADVNFLKFAATLTNRYNLPAVLRRSLSPSLQGNVVGYLIGYYLPAIGYSSKFLHLKTVTPIISVISYEFLRAF